MNVRSYQDRLSRVLRHIDNNLDERANLDALAGVAGFSPYHFHRIFTAMTGETVAAYGRRLRLQRAADQVAHTQESITQIALNAGYDSIDAFARAFRTQFGMPPSQYRRTDNPLARARTQGPETPLFYHLTPGLQPLQIQIRKFAPVTVAAVRYTGPYDQCGSAWETLFRIMGAHGLLARTGVGYSVSHDNPDVAPLEKCRMEVCIALPEGMTEKNPVMQDVLHDNDVYLREIGGPFDYAVIRVQGPYSLLHPAYRSFYGDWLPQSGREPANAPDFEAYYNSPQTTPPQDLLTEIFIPLTPQVFRRMS